MRGVRKNRYREATRTLQSGVPDNLRGCWSRLYPYASRSKYQIYCRSIHPWIILSTLACGSLLWGGWDGPGGPAVETPGVAPSPEAPIKRRGTALAAL